MSVGRSRLGLAIAATLLPVVLLVVFELGLRIAGIGGEEPQAVRFDGPIADDTPVTSFDRDLLYRLAPDSDLLGFYRTNSLGYRGSDFAAKREGTFRILAIGDSCTFGLGVHQELAWPARLEAMLDRAFDGVADFEVLNLGVPGYSSFQNRQQLAIETTRFAADGVVWLATGYNDALLAPSGADAELAARFASPWARLGESRILQLLFGKRTGFMARGAELAKLSGGPPRVPVADFARNVAVAGSGVLADSIVAAAVVTVPLRADMLAFDPSIGERQDAVCAIASGATASRRLRDEFARFVPYALHVDPIHPGVEGQALVAASIFEQIIESDYLAPTPRRDWLRVVIEAWRNRATHETATRLASAGALSWVATQLAVEANPVGSADARRFDPIVGTERGEYEAGRLGLHAIGALAIDGEMGDAAAAKRAEIRREVVSTETFDRNLFGDTESLGPQDAPVPAVLAAARTLAVLRCWLGYPRLAVDRRAAAAGAVGAGGEARAGIAAARALEPRAFYPRLIAARLARDAGDVASALALVDELLVERPTDSAALELRGMIALASADLAAARTALEASVERDPVAIDAHYGLGRIALFEGRFDAARRHLGAVKALHPARFPDLVELLASAAEGKRIPRVNR